MEEPFRLALVGAGRIGGFHAGSLVGHSDLVELVVVADPRVRDGVRVPGADVRHVASVAEVVAGGGIDGALVAVPTRHHLEVVGELLAAGVPVLCEKPCGMDAAESRRIAAGAAGVGGFLRVAFWRRYTHEMRAARDRIRAGELGAVQSVYSAQWDEYPPSAGFRDPATSGGICVDLGVHDFDLLRWLTGQEVEAVSGHASSVCTDPFVPGDPECATLSLRMSGGAVGLLSLGRRHPPGELQELYVVGTGDTLAAGYVRMSDSPMVAGAFRRQTEDFARAVRGAEDTELATVDDATCALEAAALGTAALAADVAADVAADLAAHGAAAPTPAVAR